MDLNTDDKRKNCEIFVDTLGIGMNFVMRRKRNISKSKILMLFLDEFARKELFSKKRQVPAVVHCFKSVNCFRNETQVEWRIGMLGTAIETSKFDSTWNKKNIKQEGHLRKTMHGIKLVRQQAFWAWLSENLESESLLELNSLV